MELMALLYRYLAGALSMGAPLLSVISLVIDLMKLLLSVWTGSASSMSVQSKVGRMLSRFSLLSCATSPF